MGRIESKCGIFVGHSLHDVYNGLDSLQPRGEDTAGIGTIREGGIDILRWNGKVRDFHRSTAERILNGGEIYFGEVRYSTRIGKTKKELFDGALPRYLGGRVTSDNSDSVYSHKIIRGASHALIHNGNLIGVSPKDNDTDSDVMLKYISLHNGDGVSMAIKEFPAAFAAGYINAKKDSVIVFKDRYGIRPLWIGRKAGKLVASSEDKAIVDMGGVPIRELDSGEFIKIGATGLDFFGQKVIIRPKRPCFFEGNYLGNIESSFGGIVNRESRGRLGHEIYEEYKPEVDLVSFIPNAPEPYALAYANSMGVEFKPIFYKVKTNRSFLQRSQNERQNSIASNLFVHDDVDLKDKRILLFDDSVVRFNNAPDAIKKLREREAGWIGLAVGTPPLGPEIDGMKYGCYFGIDMPPEDDFVIRRMNADEMKEFAGLDDLHYISKRGLERGLRRELKDCCAHCIGESNPVISEEIKGLDKIVDEVYRNYDEEK